MEENASEDPSRLVFGVPLFFPTEQTLFFSTRQTLFFPTEETPVLPDKGTGAYRSGLRAALLHHPNCYILWPLTAFLPRNRLVGLRGTPFLTRNLVVVFEGTLFIPCNRLVVLKASYSSHATGWWY
jgi:hypothetical protein